MAFYRERGVKSSASEGTASGRVHKAYFLEAWVHLSQFDRHEVPDSTLLFTADHINVSEVCIVELKPSLSSLLIILQS